MDIQLSDRTRDQLRALVEDYNQTVEQLVTDAIELLYATKFQEWLKNHRE